MPCDNSTDGELLPQHYSDNMTAMKEEEEQWPKRWRPTVVFPQAFYQQLLHSVRRPRRQSLDVPPEGVNSTVRCDCKVFRL